MSDLYLFRGNHLVSFREHVNEGHVMLARRPIVYPASKMPLRELDDERLFRNLCNLFDLTPVLHNLNETVSTRDVRFIISMAQSWARTRLPPENFGSHFFSRSWLRKGLCGQDRSQGKVDMIFR